MITVTESAVQELGDILAKNATEPEQVLRLAGGREGLYFGLDCEREGDEVFSSKDGAVLVIDRVLASAIDGITIDCTDTPEGMRFHLYKGEAFSEEESD